MLLAKFVCLFCLFSSCFSFETMKKYRIKLVSVKECKVPASKMDPDPPSTTNITMNRVNRDTTLLNVELNVTRHVGPIFISVRAFELRQNAARDLIFKLEKVNCNNPIVNPILIFLKLKFTKDCYFIKGSYKVDNINFDSIAGIMTRAAIQPARYIYEVEFADPKGITACYTSTCDVIEVK